MATQKPQVTPEFSESSGVQKVLSVPEADGSRLSFTRRGVGHSVKRVLMAGGIAFPIVFAAGSMTQACGLDVAGTALGPGDAEAGEAQPETSFQEAGWTNDGEVDGETIDAAADTELDTAPDTQDSGVDTGTDTGVDAGPTATFSTAAGENECIHWLTYSGGMAQAYASDNHICEPKPLSPMPINKGESIYFWSKHVPSNHKVRFVTSINPVNYFTKCSAYTNPPDKAEMVTDFGTGGYIAATNSATLPNVELINGGCPNGTSYVVQLAP